MKKKSLVSVFLLLSILLVSIVAAIGVSSGKTDSTNNQIINSGTGSMAYLNLPPPSTTIAGTPSHPTNIQLRCYDFNKHSALGAYDAMMVYLWIPQKNSYVLVALITDAPNVDLLKALWSGTFIWNTAIGALNVIQVADKDLEVWTEDTNQGNGVKGGWNGESSNVLIVTLAVAQTISLKFNLLPEGNSYKPIGDLSFTLAPLTLKFREIGDSYYDVGANSKLASGYSRQPISEMRTPAWVEETIPTWLGAVSPLEVVGHIDWHFSEVITPPAT
jgi:hypothetical protein